MKSFTQGNTAFRYVKARTQDGQRIKLATGTTDAVTADAMAAMLDVLASKAKWELLAPVTRKENRLPLDQLYAMWLGAPKQKSARTSKLMEPGVDARIEYIEVAINNTAIEPLVATFEQEMQDPRVGMKEKTLTQYIQTIRTYVKPGITAADMVPEKLKVWTKGMKDVTSDTVLRRGRAMCRFTRWLCEEGHTPFDAMKDVELPAPSDPLCHYVEPHEAQLLASRQPGQYKNFSAILAGSGIEVSVLLGLKRRDVDVAKKEIHAAGTKTYCRTRVVRVAEWCWPFVLEVIADKLPDAPLFDGIPDRMRAGVIHRDAVRTLITEGFSVFQQVDEESGEKKDYTMRDQRHSWAVYAVRGGWPLDAVAKQLGHANSVLVSRVYGRFVPTHQERAGWEALAHAAAEVRRTAIGVEVAHG